MILFLKGRKLDVLNRARKAKGTSWAAAPLRTEKREQKTQVETATNIDVIRTKENTVSKCN
jgi:hypothetical protein